MTAKAKTTEKIKQSLASMLDTMPIEEVTATALCERAGVNRATFYYHYDSVQAVITEVEEQVEREFVYFLSQSTITNTGVPEKNFYVMFFEFVARNASVCRMLLTQRQSDFFARALEAGRTKVVSVMSKLYPACPTAKIDYYYIFVSNGFLGLLEYWLDNGMKESVADIAEIGERVSYLGVGYLM